MTRILFALAALIALPAAANAQDRSEWSLVIHGGAGTIERANMSARKDAEIRAVLKSALDAGSAILADGGSSLDAVTAAITILEDDPNFNAGRGAVFTWEETNSLDASIMRGDTLEAGAVAGLSATRNPILAARKVMEASPHVLLSGEGADEFAAGQGLEQADPDWFYTEQRFDALMRYKAARAAGASAETLKPDYKFGTVGAVAMDVNGVISAGTSTGGMTGKRWGRIGDSPIIGAGTYAANGACGLSATGSGEYFIRLAAAYRICYKMQDAYQAAEAEAVGAVGALAVADHGVPDFETTAKAIAAETIARIADLGGSGGVIFLDPQGTPGWSFDTPGMYRGSATSDGARKVAIYGDE